jgi:hypothetical protein
MEDFVKVNVAATNRHHGALVEVGAKARNLSKTLKDGGKVLHIVFGWSNEDRRIIGVKRCPQNGGPPCNLVKQTMSGGKFKNLGNGVDSNDEKEGRQRVPLQVLDLSCSGVAIAKFTDTHGMTSEVERCAR